MTCFVVSASMKYWFNSICLTRPKPAYDRQGLAGGIMGPGYSSKGVYFGVLQCLELRLDTLEEVMIFGISRGSLLT